MTIKTGHRIRLRDGTDWTILSINRQHRIVRLGTRLERPQEIIAVGFAEIMEIVGTDPGDGSVAEIEEDNEQ
jgi:hypothetical protein